MLKRLQKVIKSDKHMTKDEIIDYVFDFKQGSKTIHDEVTYRNKNYDIYNKSKTISPIKDN